MKEILQKLLAVYGPSGREHLVRAVIGDMVRPYVDELRVDALGNLIAVKKGGGKRVMLAAHMDQIGFIVINADERGFLRAHNVGGVYRSNSLNRRVVFENGVVGVVSSEPDAEKERDGSMLKLFIDIGAKTREEALQCVGIGDMATYLPEQSELAGGLLCAPAMDDRTGCAALVKALTLLEGCENEVVAVFTTQEEVGLRGAKAAAYDVDPDVALAIDVTIADDIPEGDKFPVKLGGGVAIKIMDHGFVSTPEIVHKLVALADTYQIPYQREVLTGGTTDANAIHLTRSGVPSCALSVPCRYVHSASELISLDDLNACARLLAHFAMEG